MLAGWVLSYVLGVASSYMFLNDIVSVIFILFIYYLSVYLYKTKIFNKTVKDIHFQKDRLSIMSFMSFIIFIPVFFYLGFIGWKINNGDVSYLAYTKTPVTFTGKVVSRENTVNNQQLIIETYDLKDDSTNNVFTNKTYIKIPVSMFQDYELYESIQGTAVTVPLQNNFVSEK